MKNKKSVGDAKFVLMTVLFAAVVLFSSVNGSAQNRLSVISATELVKQIETSQAINYENVRLQAILICRICRKEPTMRFIPKRAKRLASFRRKLLSQ